MPWPDEPEISHKKKQNDTAITAANRTDDDELLIFAPPIEHLPYVCGKRRKRKRRDRIRPNPPSSTLLYKRTPVPL